MHKDPKRCGETIPQLGSIQVLANRGPNKTVYAIKILTSEAERPNRLQRRPLNPKPDTTLHKDTSSATQVAAKRFSPAIYAEYERERTMLRDLAHLNNDHFVHLLSSHQIHDYFFLVFPLADMDLRDFWAYTDPSVDPDHYTSWFTSQVQHLTNALNTLHHASHQTPQHDTSPSSSPETRPKGIIHGDIQPKNILVFHTHNAYNSTPVLKFHDFGLATWADAPPSKYTTRTYDAPENGLRQHLSTKSDIWSFGCVLLEFAIWLLHGNDGVEAFGDKRSMRTPGSGVPLKDDHFYTLVYEEGRAFGADVRHAVGECLRDIRRDGRCVGDFGRVVRMLEEDVLVVDGEARRSSEELARILGGRWVDLD